VLPRLELSAKKSGKTVRLIVTDAGDPVAGATVKLGGKSLKTNAAGVATVPAPNGSAKATAARPGYQPATASVAG